MAVSVRDRRMGGFSELGIGRAASFAGMLLLAIAIQSTLLAQATVLGVIPQLVLVVVVSLAFLDGERVGTVVGFFGGLLIDALLPGAIMGLTALIFTLIGYGVGLLRYMAPPDSVWTHVLTVAGASTKTLGMDRLRLRLLVFGVLLITIFVALFSRLWFLQVLAGDEYQALARENRVRRVDSEPPRGRILDRNGIVLVDNRATLSITLSLIHISEPTRLR